MLVNPTGMQKEWPEFQFGHGPTFEMLSRDRDSVPGGLEPGATLGCFVLETPNVSFPEFASSPRGQEGV